MVTARYQPLSPLDSIREVRRKDIEVAHAGMQPLERSGVVSGCDLMGCRSFVVGPQRDRETITLVDAWLHSRLKSGRRAPGSGQPLSKSDFELCDLMLHVGHPGKHVTRQQTQSEPVRVLKNDRVVDCQTK